MSGAPILLVRDGIISVLKVVPAIKAACAARVYDVVPATGPLAKLPHVSCGPAALGRGENGGDPLGLVRLRLFIASNEPTRDEAWNLAQAATDALEGRMLTLSGGWQAIDHLRIVNSGDVIDKISPNEVFLDITTIVQRV